MIRHIVMLVFSFLLTTASPALPAGQQPAQGPVKSPTGMFSTEVWLTPLILLPGVALLIISTSARFAQLQTEFHRLLDHHDAHARILSRNLLKRSALFRDALVALYSSVALFAFGSLLGAVVNLWRPESLWVVGGTTILGIACIVFASLQLIREASVCLRITVDQAEQLQKSITDEID
jgi:hypothetical protein